MTLHPPRNQSLQDSQRGHPPGPLTLHTRRVAFDPYAPYGPVVESTIRVVTWNVWGRYGADCEARQAALEETLAETAPDLVCLVEAWRQGDRTQPGRVAARLGLPYHQFVGDWQQEDWVSGFGFVSRWPMTEPVQRPLRSADGTGFGQVVHVAVAEERGSIKLFARCSASAAKVSSRFPTITA